LNTTAKHIILNKLEAGKKLLAILVDPDKASDEFVKGITTNAKDIGADLFLVGGSLLTDGDLDATIKKLKSNSNIPVIIFPGSTNQLSEQADAILFLSLLSSRNPEMLIGQQVVAAPYIKKAKLEPISTAYLLVDSGRQTTASYMSNSTPIPANKAEIAASTALAGDYLGMEFIYLDAGSGADNPVPTEMIEKVKSYTSKPLFVGGGINNEEKLEAAYKAGADIVVIGNAFEKQADFAEKVKNTLQKVNS
jgi:putative glycerol-1-phosphate prenyltransferase